MRICTCSNSNSNSNSFSLDGESPYVDYWPTATVAAGRIWPQVVINCASSQRPMSTGKSLISLVSSLEDMNFEYIDRWLMKIKKRMVRSCLDSIF